jgi:hypothetical protein
MRYDQRFELSKKINRGIHAKETPIEKLFLIVYQDIPELEGKGFVYMENNKNVGLNFRFSKRKHRRKLIEFENFKKRRRCRYDCE